MYTIAVSFVHGLPDMRLKLLTLVSLQLGRRLIEMRIRSQEIQDG